jgi:hypothetical protein
LVAIWLFATLLLHRLVSTHSLSQIRISQITSHLIGYICKTNQNEGGDLSLSKPARPRSGAPNKHKADKAEGAEG